MNAKTLVSSLACVLTLGLAACGNAQGVKQSGVPEFVSPFTVNTPSLHNVDLLKALQGKPLVRLPKEFVHIGNPIHTVKPRVSTEVYNNRQDGNANASYFSTTSVPHIHLLDQFDIAPNTVSNATGVNVSEALLNQVSFGIANDGTVTATPIVLIAVWDSLTNDAAATNVAQNLLGAFFVSVTDLPADGFFYEVTVGPLDSQGIFLRHDIGTIPENLYGIELGLILDPATTGNVLTLDTELTNGDYSFIFTGDGVTTGTSLPSYYRDTDNSFTFTNANPNEGRQFGSGTAPNLANFFLTMDADPSFYSVSGTITLDGLLGRIDDPANPGNPIPPLPQNVTIVLHDNTLTVADQTITAAITVGADAMNHAIFPFTIDGFAAGDDFTLEVKTDKSLRKNIPILISATTPVNLTGADATLPGGDANNDNHVDGGDFGALVNTYGDTYNPTDPNASPSDIAADFTGDGNLDSGDFGTLVNNYNSDGDPLL